MTGNLTITRYVHELNKFINKHVIIEEICYELERESRTYGMKLSRVVRASARLLMPSVIQRKI